jgi:hypothetical protein
MPMDFPDMQSLIEAAHVHKFRPLNDGESELEYRTALANFVAPKDFIESEEIRNGKGWDKWDDGENRAMLIRSLLKTRSR